ncbi:MAG TPA: ArgR family transcriptional regulator [Coriobacteriaceae bacterium]|nr:ArgR family transcriptional regulator [Coriobacteriaceae bacterium]
MAGARKERQDAIRDLVRHNHIRTQSDLVAQLRDRGFDVTQATISRDITDLGLEKDVRGVYMLPEDYRLRSIAASAVRETRRAQNQVLLLCDPGTASSVAAALDASQTQGVLGSIAGDDTILVICADDAQGERFQIDVNQLLEKK